VGTERSLLASAVLWGLLRASRFVLIGGVLSLVFLVLVGLSTVGLAPLRTIVESKNGIRWLFTAFIGTIVTGTSLVVTINQLVLAQELGPFGDQRERMENSMSVRRDIEAAMGREISSTDPAEYLRELAAGIEASATELQTAVESTDDERLEAAVEEYVEGICAETEQLQEKLDGAEFGSFDVIWHALQFNYSRHLADGRRLDAEYGEAMAPAANESLDATIQLLTYFAPVREHLKTLYFQWDLINLSRGMLAIALPALTVMGGLIMYVDAATFQGTVLGVDSLVLVTSAGFVVGISPFVVFIAYIVRITTVAKLTLAMGPFILQTDDGETDHDG
jgi:hypothetical protein